ncbi:Uncharacterised protein [Vibrio cholerae]|nr:Uncharacterised protein [Vibrio cholerae]
MKLLKKHCRSVFESMACCAKYWHPAANSHRCSFHGSK